MPSASRSRTGGVGSKPVSGAGQAWCGAFSASAATSMRASMLSIGFCAPAVVTARSSAKAVRVRRATQHAHARRAQHAEVEVAARQPADELQGGLRGGARQVALILGAV